MSRPSLIALPPAGVEIKPMPGLRFWQNQSNGFFVLEVHYTADPKRRGDWKLRASPKYGGLRSWRWRKEQEIDWKAQAGALVFENWNRDEHVLARAFLPPEHWPRWILFDPGWRNAASMLWIAVDIDTAPDIFGNLPVHVYREFYQSKRSAETCARTAFAWSITNHDTNGQPLMEWLEEIIIDPAAKQEHQSAAGGDDNVNDSADTVLQKFQRTIDELKWQVPVTTGNNDKTTSIEEMIERLGCFWLTPDGVPLYDAADKFREATPAEIVDGAYMVPPTLFFHPCCQSGANEMAAYKWRDWASNEVALRHNAQESPVDKDDHSITNLIRFMNHLRSMRAMGSADLTAFTPREKPKLWKSPDEILAEHHRMLASKHRRRAQRQRRVG